MVHHKRTQSRWAAKAPVGTNNIYESQSTKAGIRRTYSEDTDLSETGKYSSSSSGDESWSEMSSLPGKTKLSGEADPFVPQQSTQGSGEQRTRLSSGASVFVPGQMTSQQMVPTFPAQMPQAPANGSIMLMPQMMPMDQANVIPYNVMAPCYMAQDGCYYVGADAMCTVAMPAMLGTAPPPPPFEAPEAYVGATKASEAPTEMLSTMKDPQFSGSPKTVANASGKSRWADLNDDDDDTDDPWLRGAH